MNILKKLNNMFSLKFLLISLPLLILTIIYLCIRFALEWNVTFSMILYLLTNTLENAPVDSFKYYVGRQINLLIIFIVLYIVISFLIYVFSDTLRILKHRYFRYILYLILIVHICFGLTDLGFFDYISNMYIDSTYIEDNFVLVDTSDIVVPEEKYNLIILNLESMEQSYADKQNGGILPVNLIPGLSALSNDNICFTTTDDNAYTQMFSDYTFASMIATFSGLPFKGSLDANVVALGGQNSNIGIFESVPTIGSILKDIGYKNYAIMGCDSEFSGKGDYLINHGDYIIYDYPRAKSDGFISSNYGVRWGLEDSKVLDWSKLILTEISQNSEPFNVMIETSDIHFPDGYICDKCDLKYNGTILDSICCTDKQIIDFLKWSESQEWYENTVIVLLGDHLYMGTDCFEQYGMSGLKNRKIYNCFLNVNLDFNENYCYNRQYTTMDMCPTILSSLGIKLPNDRIGLGVNLFSGEKTLVEKDGYELVYKELGKHSNFYDKLY